MSQKRLSNDQFNELMVRAFETKKNNPKLDVDQVATLACSPYQDHADYETLVFQVTLNLVNAFR